MTTIILGDFRAKQLQYCTNSSDFTFITEDSAEYSWLVNSAITQLPMYELTEANVIVMLGFNDCVYSCVWESINIDTITHKYINTINKLIQDYPTFKFYFCSVLPIAVDYPISAYSAKAIPQNILVKKIEYFNKKLKEGCQLATFIDCYDYLSRTGFSTRDGVRCLPDTCELLSTFITSNIDTTIDTTVYSNVSADFRPRSSAADAPDPYDESFVYWTHTSANGANPCLNVENSMNSVIPNCVGYAWGRFMEILKSTPTLSMADAGEWWDYRTDGYKRGTVPQVGAVICWSKPGAAGHVAIVEHVDLATGTIITSESGWRGKRIEYDKTNTGAGSPHFWVTTRVYDTSADNWRQADSSNKPKTSWIDEYEFQGFIYNPVINREVIPAAVNVTKEQVTSHDEYLNEDSEEQQINARYIWKYLGDRGWSLEAVAGILGNMQHESTINPGLREKGHSQGGFGLVQWTPKSDLTDWCEQLNSPALDPNDIDSQLKCLEAEVKGYYKINSEGKRVWVGQYFQREKDAFGIRYPQMYGPKTFSDFIVSKASPYDLAVAFYYNYERAGIVLFGAHTEAEGRQLSEAEKEANRRDMREKRGKAAEKWYKFLAGVAPPVTVARSFTAPSLTITEVSTTSASILLVTDKSAKAYYKIAKTGSSFSEKKSNIKLDKSGIGIFEIKNLIPNTEYIIATEVQTDTGSIIRSEKIFITKQAYPKSITNIMLTTLDGPLSDRFRLETVVSTDFGFWEKNLHGYCIQLIVNRKVIQEYELRSLTNRIDFSLASYFGYTSKIGDIIQIGIRTWVKDDTGDTIFDSDFAKCSNAVCMLTKPVTMYLNID